MSDFSRFAFMYWWLIFPVGGMFMGVIGMITHYGHRNETLKILKSYADQGKDPPQALLDAMRTDEDRAYDRSYDYHRYRPYKYGRWGAWRSVIVWSALAAGFTYAGQNAVIGGAPNGVFTALGVAFGVAAAASLIWALIASFTGPKT